MEKNWQEKKTNALNSSNRNAIWIGAVMTVKYV